VGLPLIHPEWPAPANVRAFSTTRIGGVSSGPWYSLNLGQNTEDDLEAVVRNRGLLRDLLPCEPAWLKQVHGSSVVEVDARQYEQEADAAISRIAGHACAVLTADCLPLLLCELSGRAVAAVHCGWRGLAAGVIENCLQELGCPPARLLAWMGPAIGPAHYEVDMAVFDAFTGASSKASSAFAPGRPGHWQLDLYELVRIQLSRLGVEAVYGGDFCTYGDPGQFFSYRRDGETGRQASFIWLE